MELNDAARRIVGEHWRLIAVMTLLGLMLAAVMHLGDSKTYTASSRLVLGTDDPKTQSESASIADTAKAIATSPAVVRSALQKAGASDSDPLEVARHDVSVESVGASGVLQMRVSAGDPRRADRIGNALTREVIAARREVTEGQVRRVLANVNPDIERFGLEIARLDATSNPSADDEARRASLVQRRTALEAERFSALSAAAQQPKPAIISPATVPASADSSGALPDLVLGLLFGLILGVAVAGVIETFRPTLVGGPALGRELNVPLLGRLPAVDDDRLDEQARAVVGRLLLATKAAGVKNVGLMAAGDEIDVPALAQRFDLNSNGRPKAQSGHVQAFDARSAALANGAPTGLVLVSPHSLKRAELEEAKDLLSVSQRPLLGVLTCARSSNR